MSQNPIQLFDTASSTYTYILYDEQTREALLIDPVDEQLRRDLDMLEQERLILKWTVETHAHADHITSAAQLAEHTGAHMAAPAGCEVGTVATRLLDGDTLDFGRQSLRVLHTPGHTAGSMCFFWQPKGQSGGPQVFTGDTLLIGGCGRADFQSGDAGRLYDSITQKLFSLPADTVVWPGHDYHDRTQSTIGAEIASNPRLAGKSREAFIELMNNLHLPRPRRMDEAVPADQRSGLRQDAGAPAGAAHDVQPAVGYAGDISPATAHAWMQANRAVLVDVRTDAKREWVGFVPNARVVVWKQWPGMAMNPAFDEQIRDAVPDGQPVLLLCRSGVRSIAAARRATTLGLVAYNVMGGFEGDPDQNAQRGHLGGWRHAGLPWRQN